MSMKKIGKIKNKGVFIINIFGKITITIRTSVRFVILMILAAFLIISFGGASI